MENNMNFEQKLLRLQEISEALDNKNTSLEASVKLYQEAQTLLKSCKEELVKAKHIIENSDGELLANTEEYLQTLKQKD